jgi:hypothetical protein
MAEASQRFATTGRHNLAQWAAQKVVLQKLLEDGDSPLKAMSHAATPNSGVMN